MSQEEALKILKAGDNVFLTGAAGVGSGTILKPARPRVQIDLGPFDFEHTT